MVPWKGYNLSERAYFVKESYYTYMLNINAIINSLTLVMKFQDRGVAIGGRCVYIKFSLQ